MAKVLGVDFSGAKSDNNTWLAQGEFDGQRLFLHDCRRIKRSELAQILAQSGRSTIAALDFPFSVPESFVRCWSPESSSMPELWAVAADMTLADFIDLRNRFVAVQGEPKRLADTHYPECYSCLHLANPNMVPMTFHGMQMLHQLWLAGCSVPPLADLDKTGPLLLEAMPGAALKAFGLPYKGYKNGVRALDLRRQILSNLTQASNVSIQGLDYLQFQCLANHDCLDAVVAAVVAALWRLHPDSFLRPTPEGQPDYDPVVLLEGWLYAPVFSR